MPVPHIATGGQASLVCDIVLDSLGHLRTRCLALFLATWAFLACQTLFQALYEVRFCAQQHATNEVGSRDSGGALDDLETAGGFDIAVAVLAAAVGGDVVAVHDVPAAVVGDPGERSDIGGFGNGAGCPAAGFDGSDATKEASACAAGGVQAGGVPLIQAHHGGALVLEDGFIGVHADEELGAQLAGLQHGAGMALGSGLEIGETAQECGRGMDMGVGMGMGTVVAEVEAAVDPDAAVVHGDVLLRTNRPLAVGGDPFSLWAVH